MKQIFTLTFVLFTLLFQSCRDNLNVPLLQVVIMNRMLPF